MNRIYYRRLYREAKLSTDRQERESAERVLRDLYILETGQAASGYDFMIWVNGKTNYAG